NFSERNFITSMYGKPPVQRRVATGKRLVRLEHMVECHDKPGSFFKHHSSKRHIEKAALQTTIDVFGRDGPHMPRIVKLITNGEAYEVEVAPVVAHLYARQKLPVVVQPHLISILQAHIRGTQPGNALLIGVDDHAKSTVLFFEKIIDVKAVGFKLCRNT